MDRTTVCLIERDYAMTAEIRTSTNYGINYAEFNSPEHVSWKNHRQLLRNMDPREAGYRGCIGLALIVNAVNADSWAEIPGGENDRRVFVPDRTVSWASLVDVPIGYFGLAGRKRDVHWASVRPTTLRYGLPALARETETVQCDFRAFPFDKARVKTAEGRPVTVYPTPDALNPAHHPQLFRAFNALEWAMTTNAFAFRNRWQPKREEVAKALGYEFDPAKKLLAFGGGVYDGAARPQQWMPQAYIAFPARLKGEVFDRATRAPGPHGAEPKYAYGLCEAFLAAVGQHLAYRAPFDGVVTSVDRGVYRGVPVLAFTLQGDRGEHEVVRFFRDTCLVRKPSRVRFKAGEVVAEERFDATLPTNWYTRDTPWRADRWDRWVPALLPRRLDAVMRLWFERTAVSLSPGLVHYPTQVASVAALGGAVDGELYWEVSNCLDYYADDCDAIVFPPVPIHNWYDLVGWLPGDVSYDLHPTDHRFESYAEQKERVARERQERAAAEKEWAAAERARRQAEEAAEAEREQRLVEERAARKALLRRLADEAAARAAQAAADAAEAARLAAEEAEDQPWLAKGLPDPRTLTPEQHRMAMAARVKDRLAKKPKK